MIRRKDHQHNGFAPLRFLLSPLDDLISRPREALCGVRVKRTVKTQHILGCLLHFPTDSSEHASSSEWYTYGT